MSGVVTKFKIGTAVLAAVAVAGLSPVIAEAAPDDSGTDTASVGSSAGKSRAARGATTRNTDTGSSSNNDAPSTDAPSSEPGTETSSTAPAADRVANAVANATGSNPLLQNSFWWFGTPNPTPPPSTVITETQPLADIPGWARPAYGWFTDTNAQTCILGLSNVTNGSVGPYGTSTTSFSTSGC